jgi:hypothetical protein
MVDQESTLRAALRPWLARATSIVERRIADARMHAAAGSLPTADARLGELYGSLARHVSDARGHFYRVSFAYHRSALDGTIHRIEIFPSADGELGARNARILGRSYDLDFRSLVDDAKAGLVSAVLAGGGDYLGNWSIDHRDRIVARATQELSDSQIAIFEAVGQVLVKPELRGGGLRTVDYFRVASDSLRAQVKTAVAAGLSGTVETVTIRALYASEPTLKQSTVDAILANPAVLDQTEGLLPTVYDVDGRLVIEDGHHRLAAMEIAGKTTARVILVKPESR